MKKPRHWFEFQESSYLFADLPELVHELLVLHLEQVVVERDQGGQADQLQTVFRVQRRKV